MAAFIVRAKGCRSSCSPTPTFADVPASSVFFGYVERLFEQGITGGCPSSGGQLFCPKDNVPRQQMAAFLVRAKGRTQLFPPTPTFADVPPSNPFFGYIERLYEQGITGGCAFSGGPAPLPPRGFRPPAADGLLPDPQGGRRARERRARRLSLSDLRSAPGRVASSSSRTLAGGAFAGGTSTVDPASREKRRALLGTERLGHGGRERLLLDEVRPEQPMEQPLARPSSVGDRPSRAAPGTGSFS